MGLEARKSMPQVPRGRTVASPVGERSAPQAHTSYSMCVPAFPGARSGGPGVHGDKRASRVRRHERERMSRTGATRWPPGECVASFLRKQEYMPRTYRRPANHGARPTRRAARRVVPGGGRSPPEGCCGVPSGNIRDAGASVFTELSHLVECVGRLTRVEHGVTVGAHGT